MASSVVQIQPTKEDIFQMVPSVEILTYKQALIPHPYITT
jgi:hypothetical protein